MPTSKISQQLLASIMPQSNALVYGFIILYKRQDLLTFNAEFFTLAVET